MKKNDREFARYYLDPRADVLRVIPAGIRTALDVGCGGGALGGALKERGISVTGIEKSPAAAAEARSRLDRVCERDVEEMNLPFREGEFDCILLCDVLEHLHDPGMVLAGLRKLLAPGGCVVCSIPNVRYYAIIKDLLFRGAWEYRDAGILDRTHLRFFTLKSIREMLAAAGYRIERLERVNCAAPKMRLLNRLLLGRLADLCTDRYLIVARAREAGAAP